MFWTVSSRADQEARVVADRHYNRQKIGTPQFVPPGRCLVLKAPGPSLWVTSWPFAEYVKHDWPGAWVCSAFRREGGVAPASVLIGQAVAATRWTWPETPALGMVTFVDPKHVRPTRVRGEDVYGWCFLRAGIQRVGSTKGGLLAFLLPPDRMPDPEAPLGSQSGLFGAVRS